MLTLPAHLVDFSRSVNLGYDGPMGFAHFGIGVLNSTRPRYELHEAEVHEIGRVCGHRVAKSSRNTDGHPPLSGDELGGMSTIGGEGGAPSGR